jgi:hypothetical protein
MTTAGQTSNAKNRNLVLYGIVAGLLLALHFFHPPQRGLWARVFFDSLHVPVFGLIAVSLYAALARWPLPRRIAVALAVTTLLGIISEVAQLFTARDASLRDLVSDVLGAIGFTAAAVAFAPLTAIEPVKRLVACAAAIVALTWPLLPLIEVSAAYYARNTNVPVLIDFESHNSRVFSRIQNADLEIISFAGDGNAAKVTLGPGAWPGITLHDLWPDWRQYSTLIVDVSNDRDTPVTLYIRVHDREHIRRGNAHSDRFNSTMTIKPGRQPIEIPLAEIRTAPRDREMDLSGIEGIIIFGTADDAGLSFYLHEVRLR